MSPETQYILDIVNNTLKQASLDYEIKGSTWYFEKKDFLLILELQRSEWGSQYYINFDIYLRSEEKNEKYPKAHKSDIKWRIHGEQIGVPEYRQAIDFEAWDKRKILEFLTMVLQKQIISLINSINSIKDVKEFVKKNEKNIAVTVQAKKMLGLPIPPEDPNYKPTIIIEREE